MNLGPLRKEVVSCTIGLIPRRTIMYFVSNLGEDVWRDVQVSRSTEWILLS